MSKIKKTKAIRITEEQDRFLGELVTKTVSKGAIIEALIDELRKRLDGADEPKDVVIFKLVSGRLMLSSTFKAKEVEG